MSNNIENYRNCLKSVKPLLKYKRLKLDVLKEKLEEKNIEFDKFKLVYDEKYLKKHELLIRIESITDSGKSLDLNMLSNAKHYLTEINNDLIDASSSLQCKQQALDKASSMLLECHVDVKLMEKYEENKKLEFKLEEEKLEARQIEDLWLQNKIKKIHSKEKINE